MSEAEEAWREFCREHSGHDFAEEYLSEPAPVPTGTQALDEALGGGLHAGLNVVAGAPGSFKTGFCVWSFHTQALAGARPVYLSLEMPWLNVALRMGAGALVRANRRPYAWGQARRMGFRPLDEAEGPRGRYQAAQAYLRELGAEDPVLAGWREVERTCAGRCAVVDSPEAHDVGAACRALRALAEAGWRGPVYVDYMGLMTTGVEGQGELERMAQVSAELAALARDCRLPVVALHALRKQPQKDAEKPSLAALKGTGAIGYDAESATILAAGRELDARAGTREMVATVVKNRHGQCGEVRFPYQPWSGWVGQASPEARREDGDGDGDE